MVDPSPHKIRFVTAQKGVKPEALDWGGNGVPLVFLAGLGNTAHTFDDFAPKFTAHHHVYAITRRGFGASSVPAPTGDNYDSDRLGDDVLDVMDVLKLERPFIAGHSISGLELTSIGTRHPEKVSSLIYLDAISSSRAYYSSDTDTFEVDIDSLRRILDRYPPAGDIISDFRARIEDMQTLMPRLEKELANLHDQLQGVPDSLLIPNSPQQQAARAILNGEHKYGTGTAPILTIVASPPACGSSCDTSAGKKFEAQVSSYIDAFQTGNPQAHIVRLARANHQVWRSNEADVIREMNELMDHPLQ
jgi:pimeloyl-ACP methyl ester carboxylesterase